MTEPVDADDRLPPWGHLRCLVTLGLTCAYLSLRPSAEVSLAFLLAPFLLDLLASRSQADERQPRPDLPEAPFRALVYLMFALHWTNLVLAADYLTRIDLLSAQALTAGVLLSLSSSLAAGATGHELIHRRGALDVLAGRFLLASLFYEHLYTEHLRGHHARAGTPEDPTTARLDETLLRYLWRAVPGQISSALHLEARRLAGRAFLTRLVLNRVMQGFLLEASLVALFAFCFGWAGAAALVLPGLTANLLFQVVNYFQHWGVARDPSDPSGIAWDTSNRSTLFSMVGLARHTDHHFQPRRPFQALRWTPGANTLPGGYGQVIFLAVFRNRRFRELMRAELQRRGRLQVPTPNQSGEPPAPSVQTEPSLQAEIGVQAEPNA